MRWRLALTPSWSVSSQCPPQRGSASARSGGLRPCLRSASLWPPPVITMRWWHSHCSAWRNSPGVCSPRRIRPGVWAGLLLACIPFLLSFPLLLHFREIFGTHFWSKPTWGHVFSPYGRPSGLTENFSLVLVALWAAIAADQLRRRWRGASQPHSPDGFSPAETILIGGFLAYPSAIATLAILQHGGYTERYGWPVILGLALATMSLFRRSWAGAGAARLLTVLLLVFALQGAKDSKRIISAELNSMGPGLQWPDLARRSRNEPHLPVAVASGLRFLEMAHYAEPDLRGRLVQLVDPQAAILLADTDSVDNTARQLRQFVPLRVEDAAPFLAAHSRFLIYATRDRFSWLPRYLLAKQYRLELLSEDADAAIYRAERQQ